MHPARFFSAGNASQKGSSFDLTIGTIFDHEGEKVKGHFTLQPGQMVQVISAEVFNLPPTITGHVTYKTNLTKKGIWALTIGIVDPGWDGPITTSLLNFSKVAFVLQPGAPFLRVSFFEHDPAPDKLIRKMGTLDGYEKEALEAAITVFPRTFLNQEAISTRAKQSVLNTIRKEGLAWVVLIGLIFTVMQWVANSTYRGAMLQSDQDFNRVRTKVETLEARVIKLEAQPAQPAVDKAVETPPAPAHQPPGNKKSP